MSEIFVNHNVSRRALNEFFSEFPVNKDEIHTLQIYSGGKPVVRIAPSPYSVSDKREVYSLSKSFCSTAIGFLVDEGKLSLEDRVIDLFPDKLPDQISDNLREMRLKHVLSMNTGHEFCVLYPMKNSSDGAREFLAQEVKFKPGTHFTYNTGATCFLSCIVEKITGMKLIDYLTVKLFLPLEITDIRWNRILDGTNEGGCGLHVSSDDIIKLGLLYINKGMWKGKRLLSEEWVKNASSPVSDNSVNGTPDWCSGYGFQFWCNSREGFRGDGAFGQLCVVLPEHDMVFAVQAELGDMQHEMDAVFKLADHLFDDDDTAELILPEYAPLSSQRKTAGFENKFFKLDENPLGWTGIYFTRNPENDSIRAVISNAVDQYAIEAGNGSFLESLIFTKKLKPKIVFLMSTPDTERCRIASSYAAEENKLTFAVRFLNSPHRMTFTFTCEDDRLTIVLDEKGLLDENARRITGYLVK